MRHELCLRKVNIEQNTLVAMEGVFPIILSRRDTSPALDCPICYVKTERLRQEGVDIDRCPKCHGIWLDKRELKKLTKNSNMYKYLLRGVGTESDSKLVCPR